jgi:hypothetical protein
MKEGSEESDHWYLAYVWIICNAFGAKSSCAAICFSPDFEKVIQIHVRAQKQG